MFLLQIYGSWDFVDDQNAAQSVLTLLDSKSYLCFIRLCACQQTNKCFVDQFLHAPLFLLTIYGPGSVPVWQPAKLVFASTPAVKAPLSWQFENNVCPLPSLFLLHSLFHFIEFYLFRSSKYYCMFINMALLVLNNTGFVLKICIGNNRLCTQAVLLLVSIISQHKSSQDQVKTSASSSSIPHKLVYLLSWTPSADLNFCGWLELLQLT